MMILFGCTWLYTHGRLNDFIHVIN